MELGKRIKELRKTLNWNQDELAEKMFVSRQTISSWENDKNYPTVSHLNEIERLVEEFNEKEKQVPIRLPDLKIVITGTQYGYKREDGVFVIPIGCLKD